MTRQEIARLLGAKDYAGLEAFLAKAELKALAGLWPSFSPLERLTLFKLLDAQRAMDLFRQLSFAERYLLFLGFPLAAIAPVLEGLPLAAKRHFVQLPRGAHDDMFRSLTEKPA